MPLALGLGWMAGYRVVTGAWPSLPATEASGWLFWLAGALGAGATVLGPRRAGWLGLATPAFLALMLQAKVTHAWSSAEAALWIAGLTGALLATALAQCVVAERVAAWLALAGPLVTAIGAALVLAATGSLLLGGLAAVLALALGLLFGLALVRPSGVRPAGAWAWGAVILSSPILSGLEILGFFYSSLPAASAILLVLAPTWALLGLHGRPGVGVLASVGCAAAAVVAGIAVAGLTDAARAFLPT